MDKIFVPFLPPWAETGFQPAFYDVESGTVLQQTARMYDKVNQLIRLFNEFSETVTNEVNAFEQNVNDNIEQFEHDVNETVADYIEKFTALKDFVDDYFDNLDVQEEINNKLDAMVEDGTLQEIITTYIQSNVAWTFNHITGLQSATNLTNGSFAQTYGFYDRGDGGGAMYVIRNPEPAETGNGITTFDITGGLIAEIVKHPIMSAKQFGCKANGTDDDTTALQGAIDYCCTKKVVLHMDSGTYMVSQVVISNTIKITGDGTNSIIRGINSNTAESIFKIYNDGLLNTEVSNIQIDGNLFNTSSVVDGIELEEDRVNGGGDKYTYIHDIKVKNCTGYGIHVDGTDSSAVREIRMENLNVGDCRKNGIYINNCTDSMFDKITSHGNIQYGIEVGGGSHKFSNCKCFWNGKGDETTRDASRAPADAFTATSDASPQPDKIYYTRSGNGVQNDWYVFTEFTGDSFDGGTTYYEMTTIYTKRYAGFKLNTNACVYTNLEAQDNYGDGIELGGAGNQLSSIKLDNNGLLCDENNVPISYATAGKTQCYYGIYGRGYRTDISGGIFVNHRSGSIGKSQAGAVFLTQSTWFLLNGGGDNVDNNTPVFTQGLDWLARVKIQGHYNGYPIQTEIRLADIIPRTGLSWVDGSAKVIDGICHIQGELKDTNGIVPNANERVIFGLAGAYTPSKNTFTTAYVSNDHGYTLGGIVTLKIGSNSAVSVKAADSSLASYQNLIFDFQFPVAVNSW